MKTDYTHCSLVVDRSGSMATMAQEATEGIATFLKEQFALDGSLTVTLRQFDTRQETVARMATEPFIYALDPRDMTALLDAIGMEIVQTGADLAALPEDERPEKVLFVIVTDGLENASKEYTMERVRNLIADQRGKYNWDFIFLGAGDSFLQGDAIGVASVGYDASAAGTSDAYARLNHSTMVTRSGVGSLASNMGDPQTD